jgi:N-acetylglutamate synthase-like GNAT family acetyltransferase
MNATVSLAAPPDFPALARILRAARLSPKGLDACRWVLKAEVNGLPVGVAAIEMLGPYAFFRSLAVDQRLRGQGIGGALMRERIVLCRREHVPIAYCATGVWGVQYHQRFGFRVAARAALPEQVRRHWQVGGFLYGVAYRLFVRVMELPLAR